MSTAPLTFRDFLVSLDACGPALDWLGDRTAEQTLAECERSDWLIWWVFRVAGLPDQLTRRDTHGVLAEAVLAPMLPRAGASRPVGESVVALLRRSAAGGYVSTEEWAARRAPAIDGKKIAARTPMIATTIKTSINVNPRRGRGSRRMARSYWLWDRGKP